MCLVVYLKRGLCYVRRQILPFFGQNILADGARHLGSYPVSFDPPRISLDPLSIFYCCILGSEYFVVHGIVCGANHVLHIVHNVGRWDRYIL